MRAIYADAKWRETGSLVLVNPDHPLRRPTPEGHLAPLPAGRGLYLHRQASSMLDALLKDLEGREDIVPVSGYRSRAQQSAIYRDALREHGQTFTRKFVALPGCSEHETGLAVDLAENRGEIDFLCPSFPQEGTPRQFRRRAADYGFIERYPAGREEITRIAHEPWHFRYVGFPHARIMAEDALTLEEYTHYLRSFPHGGQCLERVCGGRRFSISFVPLPETGRVEIRLPERRPYQLSGNNVDGAVVTIWR